jgi:hypothetical protein
VESGSLAEAVFAIDLGAVAIGDPGTPTVYRDSDAFFAATYATTWPFLFSRAILFFFHRGDFQRSGL